MNTPEPVKKISAIFMVIFLVTSMIIFIVWSLLSFWRSEKPPVAYIIQDAIPNRGDILKECDEPYITVLKGAVSGQIRYKCGNLGTFNEIVILYD